MNTTLNPSTYELSVWAGCDDPDTDDSPGAEFLHDILEHYQQQRDDYDALDLWLEQALIETIDDHPDRLHELWTRFADLGAYRQAELPPRYLGGVHAVAINALVKIGERLGYALEFHSRGGK